MFSWCEWDVQLSSLYKPPSIWWAWQKFNNENFWLGLKYFALSVQQTKQRYLRSYTHILLGIERGRNIKETQPLYGGKGRVYKDSTGLYVEWWVICLCTVVWAIR